MLINTPRDWGNVVRDRRLALDMTQEQLAERVGKARQWVVRFESGNAGSASLASLTVLLDVLGLTVEVSQFEPEALLDAHALLDPEAAQSLFRDLTTRDSWS